MTNKFLPWAPQVSTIETVTVVIRENEYYFDKNFRLIVNGFRVYYPYFYPSAFNAQITIRKCFDHITIIDKSSGAKIDYYTTYGNPQLCITLPQSTEFYGQNTLCGVLGNIDDNCHDDYITSNGTNLNLPCHSGSSLAVAEWADTWITNHTANNCVPGASVINNTNCVRLFVIFIFSYM